MNADFYAIVWIDHQEAKIFHLDVTEIDRLVIRPHDPARRIRHEANSFGGDRPEEQDFFFERIAGAIIEARAILITGPESAKSELAAHVMHRHLDLARRIAGVETIDHPGSGALVALARIYFRRR